MNADPDPPLIALPDELDDAAACALLEFFHEAARVLEAHYAGQLLRHHHQRDKRQQPLWEDDPPF